MRAYACAYVNYHTNILLVSFAVTFPLICTGPYVVWLIVHSCIISYNLMIVSCTCTYMYTNVSSFLCRYYTTEFDWNENVVTIKQLSPLSKFDKWWMSKCMCIEGNL